MNFGMDLRNENFNRSGTIIKIFRSANLLIQPQKYFDRVWNFSDKSKYL